MKKRFISILAVFIAGIVSFSAKAQNIADFTTASENSIHSVVHIQCTYSARTNTMMDFFEMFLNPMHSMQRTYQTSGSGVILNSDGHIITNNHVVADADTIVVILNDRRSFRAKIIGSDPSADLALVKIEANGLNPISFGNSDDVRIGEWVLAVGNPFNLTSTVTAGIVSAKARNINILGNKMSQTPIESFIQTDAAINSGNSGGALVNLRGELIGINTAIASSTGSYAGYSFAIPSNIVKKVANDLMKYGTTQKAYMGVKCGEVNAQLAASKGLKDLHGLYISDIFKGGAAEKSGLKEGDIISKINGKSVNTNAEFDEIMAQSSPNQQVEVEYERNGKINTKTLVLLNSMGTSDVGKVNLENVTAAGVVFRKVSKEESLRYNLSNEVGVVVVDVGQSSFARIGIRNGLVITSIDRQPATIEAAQLLNTKKGQQVEIEGVSANGQQFYYMLIL